MKENKISKRLNISFLLLITILIIVFSIQSSFATTIDENTPGGIRVGISGASSGGTLFLEPGTYNKTGNDTNISINQRITIQGIGPSSGVIIDARGLSRIFTITSNQEIRFINLTFKNGLTTANGGAIYKGDITTTIRFFNCTFINNTGNQGGAISNNGNNMYLENCEFINNTAIQGGAIFNSANNVYMDKCNFTYNNASEEGGAIASYRQNTYITNCNFVNNTGYQGGAIANYGNNIQISTSNFTNNTATNGGAIANYGSYRTVSGCNFIDNTATNGGAIYNRGSTELIQYNRFLNNTDSNGLTLVNILGTVTANFNWWGSNNNPSSIVSSGVSITNWFVMVLNVNNPYDTMINATINRSAGNYILSYRLALYNSNLQTFVNVGYSNLPDFLVTVKWTDIGGNIINIVSNVNAKGSYSFQVTLTNVNRFTINAVGDNEDVHLILGGEFNIRDVNLTITKTANATKVSKGDIVTYTITVTNPGPDTAYHVGVHESISNLFVLVASTHSHGSYYPDIGLWEIGNLNGSDSATLTITVLVNGTGIINNQVILTTDNNNFGSRVASFSIQSQIPANSTIILPHNVKVGKTIKISGYVRDDEGHPLKNIKVTVTIDGKKHTVKTDSNGKWVLNYIPKHPGIFDIKVTWNGSDHHFSFSNTTTIHVKKSNGDNDDNGKDDNNGDDDDSDNNNNPTEEVSSAMKKTGTPMIITILLILLSICSTSIYRKQK